MLDKTHGNAGLQRRGKTTATNCANWLLGASIARWGNLRAGTFAATLRPTRILAGPLLFVALRMLTADELTTIFQRDSKTERGFECVVCSFSSWPYKASRLRVATYHAIPDRRPWLRH